MDQQDVVFMHDEDGHGEIDFLMKVRHGA
jgi:hypothetical protein